MQHGRRSLAFLLLFLAVAAWGHAALAGGWTSWAPKDRSFSVSFPASPQSQTNTQGARPIHLVTSKAGNENFAVLYMELSAEPATVVQAREVIDAGSQAYMNGGQGKLLKKRDLTLGAHPGRELEVQDADKITLIRFYAVGKRVYQLSAVRPFGAAAGNAQRFMDSFKLPGRH